MVTSATELANMALSHLGVGSEIDDLTTETSAQANAVNRFYDTVLHTILRDGEWGFARKQVALTLVDTYEVGDGYEFRYAYRYPTTCVRVRRILSGARVDTPESTIAWREGLDAAGRLIFADVSIANSYNSSTAVWAEITTSDIPIEHWPADFVLAFTYLLASMIAPRVTSEPTAGQRALQSYYMTMSMASKNDAKESAPDVQYDSEFITARDS